MAKNMPSTHGDKRLRCGQCKWFFIGFEGNNCQRTREVLADNQACIEFQPYRDSFFSLIERDKYIRELERSIKTTYDPFLKTISEEIKTYHLYLLEEKDRSPGNYLLEENILELSHRFEVCQAYTDRVVEIKNLLVDRISEIQGLLKDAQGYVFAQYPEQTKALKNDSERGAFYRHILPVLTKIVEKLESLQVKVDNIHTNLKDTHFAMSKTQDGVLQVWEERTRNLVSRQRAQPNQ